MADFSNERRARKVKQGEPGRYHADALPADGGPYCRLAIVIVLPFSLPSTVTFSPAWLTIFA